MNTSPLMVARKFWKQNISIYDAASRNAIRDILENDMFDFWNKSKDWSFEFVFRCCVLGGYVGPAFGKSPELFSIVDEPQILRGADLHKAEVGDIFVARNQRCGLVRASFVNRVFSNCVFCIGGDQAGILENKKRSTGITEKNRMFSESKKQNCVIVRFPDSLFVGGAHHAEHRDPL